MRRLFRSFVLLPLGVAACSQSGVSSTIVPETALAVDPSQFLGAINCDQMRSYVATIVDMSSRFDRSVRAGTVRLDAGIGEFALPSSGPTPCFQTVLFERIVTGRQYRAEVDGYDRYPGDIEPIAVGSRIMVDKATPPAYVAPLWKTTCNKSWSPPSTERGRSPTDGSIETDAGELVDGGGSGTADGQAPSVFPDAAVPPYLDCRGNRLRDGGGADGAAAPRPWLGGPVCAVDFETITFNSCEPLK
jgi:hypothetical protein